MHPNLVSRDIFAELSNDIVTLVVKKSFKIHGPLVREVHRMIPEITLSTIVKGTQYVLLEAPSLTLFHSIPSRVE